MTSNVLHLLRAALALWTLQGLAGCGSDDSVAVAPATADVPADVALVGADLALPASAKAAPVTDAATGLADLAELGPPGTSALPDAELMPPT
jgi:hypothetical protein